MSRDTPIYCSECRIDVDGPCDLLQCPLRAGNTKAPQNVVPFVNWNSQSPEDIVHQVLDWLRWHKERGHTVHVIGCVVHSEPDNPNDRFYQPFFSPTPAEIIHYACFRVQERSWEKIKEG
jgi:hypothetical protein